MQIRREEFKNDCVKMNIAASELYFDCLRCNEIISMHVIDEHAKSDISCQVSMECLQEMA